MIRIRNWNIVLLYYFKEKKDKQTIFLYNGTKCIIRNKSDVIAFLENFVLEANTSDKKFKINHKEIIVDIGAHVGYFTLFAAKKATEGKVIAFEPSIESFLGFKENMKMNNFKNIMQEKTAIAKVKGKQTLYVNDEDAISNTIYKQSNNLNKEEVECISLQDIFEKYELKKIDFLKMDCEGAEYEIIMNAESSNLNKIQKIAMEIHEEIVPYKKEVIIENLKKHGFNVKLQRTISGVKMELPLLLAWR